MHLVQCRPETVEQALSRLGRHHAARSAVQQPHT